MEGGGRVKNLKDIPEERRKWESVKTRKMRRYTVGKMII